MNEPLTTEQKVVPAGLVRAKCVGCRKVWWIEPPQGKPPTKCMCCGKKLRFSMSVVDSDAIYPGRTKFYCSDATGLCDHCNQLLSFHTRNNHYCNLYEHT